MQAVFNRPADLRFFTFEIQLPNGSIVIIGHTPHVARSPTLKYLPVIGFRIESDEKQRNRTYIPGLERRGISLYITGIEPSLLTLTKIAPSAVWASH